MILRIIIDIIQAYIVVLFVRIMLTWFPLNPWSRAARVERALARVTDPLMVPVRKVVHPVRIGAMGLDLAPIVVFFGLLVLITILRSA